MDQLELALRECEYAVFFTSLDREQMVSFLRAKSAATEAPLEPLVHAKYIAGDIQIQDVGMYVLASRIKG